MLRNLGQPVLLLVAVALLALAVPGAVAAQDMVTMEVTVVDQHGQAIGGVSVTAEWDGGSSSGTTASNGMVLLDVPDGEDVAFTTDDDRYVRNTEFTVENAGGGAVEIPVAPSGTATIEVVDSSGPVQGAIVQVVRDGNYVINARTDSQGMVSSDAIEYGEYRATAWGKGYLRNKTEMTVDGDVTHQIRIEEDSRLMRVTVLDDHFSPAQPVGDATVSVENRGDVSTLSNGQTTLQVPVNTDYDVTVTKDGYESNATTVSVRESEVATNLTINREDAITLETANSRVVVGETVGVTVTDEYGDPVDGAVVNVGGESVGETNDQGTLSVAIDRSGTHNLTATSGNLEATATVEGVSGASGDATPDETATAEGDTTNETDASDGSGPGFTVVTMVAAVLTIGFLLRRH